jgi:PPOX class probable F420-dependent enzyme
LGQEEVDPRAVELLRSTLIGQLGYNGLDGYPRVLPVWFEYRDGEVLIGSKAGLYKGRALARDGRASMAVSTPERPYLIAVVVGDATVERLPEAERIPFVTALAHRYLGPEGGKDYMDAWIKGGHPGDGELIRLRPRRITFYLS